jgi:hypothetical protein
MQEGRERAAAVVYGSVAGGMTNEADEFIRSVMADTMDGRHEVPG